MKIAREELIRRHMMKQIFKNGTDHLACVVYDACKNEAQNEIMHDANSYLIKLTTLKSQIVPKTYPAISLKLWIEVRNKAVQ
jgi:hypothetical protein